MALQRAVPEKTYFGPTRPAAVSPYTATKLRFASGDAVLVALDAKTGKEVWTAKVAENKQGYYESLAPIVIEGKVLMGTSGGDVGIRGFVGAFDAGPAGGMASIYGTGPRENREARRSRPAASSGKSGGGSTWVAGN